MRKWWEGLVVYEVVGGASCILGGGRGLLYMRWWEGLVI